MSESIRALYLSISETSPLLLLEHLRQAGYQAALQDVGTDEAFDAALKASPWDMVFADHEACKDRVRALADRLAAIRPHLPLILVAKEVSPEAALAAIRAGAQDVLARSELADRLALVVARELRKPVQCTECPHHLETVRELEQKYHLIFEGLDDAVFVVDAETGYILDINKQAEVLLGRSRDEIIGMHQAQLHPRDPADRYYRRFQRAVAIGRFSQDRDTEVLRKDGRIVPISLSATLVAAGGRRLAVGVFRDISHRRQVEQEQEATVRLLRLINAADSTQDLAGKAIAFLRDWLGCDAVGIRLRDGEDFPYFLTAGFSEEFVAAENHPRRVDAAGTPVRDADGRLILECMCGQVLACRFDLSQPFFTEHGSFWTGQASHLVAGLNPADPQQQVRVRCMQEGYESVALIPLRLGEEIFGLLQVNDKRRERFNDKTVALLEQLAGSLAIALSQRRTEEALRQSEERYRQLVELSPDAIYIHQQGRLVFVNLAGLKLFGASHPEQVLGKHMLEMIHPDYRDIVAQRISAINEQRKAAPLLAQKILRLDGSVGDTEAAATAFEHNGQRAVLVIARDISERIQAEEALRRSEDEHRTLFETMAQGVVYLDAQGKITSANPAAGRIMGFDQDVMCGRDLHHPMWDVIREDGSVLPAEAYPAVLALRSGARVSKVVMGVMNPQAGQRRWIDVSAVPLFRAGQTRPHEVYITFEDITERKEAQEALRKSEEQYRTLVEDSPMMICRWAPDTTYSFVNTTYARCFGVEPKDWVGMRYNAGLGKEALRQLEAYVARLCRERKITCTEETVELPSGEVRWHRWTDCPLLDAKGDLIEVQSIGEDITDRKRAEEALRQSEERFRRLAGNVQDIIFRLRLRPAPDVEYISPAVTTVLGYTVEECYNGTVDSEGALHPDDRGQLAEYLAGKLPFEKPFIIRVLRNDGAPVLLEVCSTPIHDAAGALQAIEGIARDITDRQRAEEAQRERTSLRELSHRILQSQEEERRRLSRELHDEAGQALTAIKLNTELLAKRVPDNLPALKLLAKDTSEVTAGLISEMRRIAAALRPTVLEDLGLLPTLRGYTKGLQMRYGLRVKLISRGLKGRLDPSFETTIYRIVQEALTNVVRHAQARQAEVKVTCSKSGLDLLVQDDGKGMDLGRLRKGTGLTGIRERAHLFAGTMTLESQVGAGTTLRIKFRTIPEAST